MLWDYFKHLKTQAPIYNNIMDEDENSIPQHYVVLEEGVYDESLASGDGLSLVRKSSFNIRIHSRTFIKAKSLTTSYRAVLLQRGMAFQQYGPTYDPNSKYYSVLITGTQAYGT